MVYLDYAATTPLDPQIFEAMLPYLREKFGNASSVHEYGREARMAIERSRNLIAKSLGVGQGEILFTGSASEANNLVVKGIIENVISSARRNLQGISPFGRDDRLLPEIVVSAIEHPCIMEAVRHVERLGWVKVVWLPVDQSGHVRIADVEEAINDRTVLVSVMYVNNEIGSVQPVKEISKLVKRERERRNKFDVISNAGRDPLEISRDARNDDNADLPIWLHTDAVQAIQYFDCSPAELGVDLMTLAPHKAYGPKGIGVLYKNEKVLLTRQVDGGGQEYYLRAGTENVANVVGAGLAIEQAVETAKMGTEKVRLANLRTKLVDELKNVIDEMVVIGEGAEMSPHIVNLIIKDCDAEALIAALDREGFAVSSGSACSSGVVKKSHVIEALKLGVEKYAPLRISFGRETTEEQLRGLVGVLPGIIRKIRSLYL